VPVHKRITASVDIANIFNKVALYNFLSTFSGTHFLQSRTVVARIGLVSDDRLDSVVRFLSLRMGVKSARWAIGQIPPAARRNERGPVPSEASLAAETSRI